MCQVLRMQVRASLHSSARPYVAANMCSADGLSLGVMCMHLLCRLLCGSQAAAARSQLPSLYRGIQTAAPLAGDVKIEVPSMGDSISEGTVASVAKQAGKCTICKSQLELASGLVDAHMFLCSWQVTLWAQMTSSCK